MLTRGPTNRDEPDTSKVTKGSVVPRPIFPFNIIFPLTIELPKTVRPYGTRVLPIFKFVEIDCVPRTVSNSFNKILLMSKSGQILIA